MSATHPDQTPLDIRHLCGCTRRWLDKDPFERRRNIMWAKADILNELQERKGEVEQRYHVKRMGLFGSYSRGEQRVGSDIDILVDFNDDADLFDLAGLKIFLEEMFQSRVDVIPSRALREELKQAVLADVKYV